MAKLNKIQLAQLGDSYLLLAQAVGNYRIEHYNELSSVMKKRIREYHKNLIDYADMYYAASTIFIVENVETSLAQIANVTSGLDKAIKKVNKVQLVINTVAAAVRLGASIVSKQPKAITTALNDLVKTSGKLKKD